MNLFAIAGLSVAISCACLVLLSFLFGKTRLHRLLLIFNFVVAIWGFGGFMVGIASTPSEAILGWKIAYLGGFFVGPIFYHLTTEFCGIQRRKILYFAYSQAAITVVLSFGSDHVINKTRYVFGTHYNDATFLYALAVVLYLFFVLLSYIELIRFFQKAKGHKRIQTFYMISGFMFGFLCGTSTFVPMFGIDVLYPAGNFGVTLYTIILTYAILRHRLMDIRIVIRKTMVYSLSAGILTGLFVVLVLALTRYFSDLTGRPPLAITILSALIIAFLFHPLKNRVQSFIDRAFYRTTYDYYSMVQKVSRELTSTIDIKYIFLFIVNTVLTTLKLQRVFLLSEEDKGYVVACSRLAKDESANMASIGLPELSMESELLSLARNQVGIILKEDLPVLSIPDKAKAIEEELNLFKGELAVPIFVEDRLLYLLIIGEKLSGDFFTDEDINLLSTIANQSAVSLKNARLHEKLKRSGDRLRNLTVHIQSISEQERKRIAREIHDELGQALTSMKMDTFWLKKKMPEDQGVLREKIDSMSDLISDTISTVQRISSELRPRLLDDLGLQAAMEWHAKDFQERTGVACDMTVNLKDAHLDQEHSTTIFRIFQESLTNVARHAGATEVFVRLKENGDNLVMTVADNGKGIEEEQKKDPESFGLIGMRERVRHLGGSIDIRGIKDQGTTIKAVIPGNNKNNDDSIL